MKTSGRRPPSAGFTLPEILVAFLILALALGALLPSFSTGLASLELSTFHATALAEARSQIDRLGIEIPLEEGELTGTSGTGFDWVMRLRRHDLMESQRPSKEGETSAVVPYEVEVVIVDTVGRTLTIKTLRLAPLE